MTLRLELGAQLDVIEDLAVEDDPQRLAVIRKWLLAGGKIDDRKPRVCEARVCVAVKTELIGTTVIKAARHAHERLTRRWWVFLQINDAADATH